MTNLLSKLFVWVKNTGLVFLVILCALSAYSFVTSDSNNEKELAKRFEEKKLKCSDSEAELAELKRKLKAGIPFTEHHIRKKSLEKIVAACNVELKSIEEELDGLRQKIQSSFLKRFVQPNVSTALLTLLLMLVTPKALKVVLYFVLAPIALRRDPLVIVANANGGEHSTLLANQQTQIGAVSQSVSLAPTQELLVHSDYLQSIPLHAKKRTKWLLNNSIPLSSISSGMYMLTCVECASRDPIVISSTKDHLPEIGIVEIPKGAAFVCQPRSLVGVVYERDQPVRVSKHWRLGSLQGWLTFQFRFLVFHGPARLLIKGGRGIRMETAAEPRLLNQNATLGFSANLKYGNARCATFVPYWAGKEGLFHDLFSGAPGVYVYEEVSAANSGDATSFFERAIDAVLKAFGI